MGIFCADADYGIGLAQATISPLRLMHVPVPDQVVWKPYAIYYSRADFSRVGDGFASIEWIWDVISASSLYKLLEILAGAEYKSVYVNSDIRDGTSPKPSEMFHIYTATMWKPILSGQEGVSVARTPYAFQTVKIQFVNATLVV